MPQTAIAALAVLPVLLWLQFRNYKKTIRPTLDRIDVPRTILVVALCVWVSAGLALEGEWLLAAAAGAFVLFIAWTCGGFHRRLPTGSR